MKISSKYVLHALAALFICVSVASCADNEMAIGGSHALQPGEYPLTLTASVDEMTSRSDGKESWVDGDTIAVRIGQYPNVGCYMLNSDGTVMSAEKSLDWHTTESSTVTAWFPYVDLDQDKTVSISDQSHGFKEYDFLTAVAPDQIYTNAVNLNFKHQMAKVSCKIMPDDVISDDEWESVKVSIGGYTKASFRNGSLSGDYDDNNKWITPVYDAGASAEKMLVFEALVVPRKMNGEGLIKIDLDVNSNNNLIHKTLIYTLPDDIDELQGGNHYKFTVTVKKDSLEVNSLSASWSDDSTWHRAEPAVFKVYLPEKHGQSLIYSDNVDMTPGDSIFVHGNRFSISYEVTDENITKVFQISKETENSDRNTVYRTVNKNEYNKFIYTFNYYILSEVVTLDYVDFLQVGDYYYEDGTWGPSIFKEVKRPIGIVFKTGAGEDDKVSNYNKVEWDVIHGYAVALHDATTNRIVWGAAKTFVKTYGGETTLPNSPYSGYNYTQLIKATGDEKKYDYTAVKAALDYRIDEAPESSSGWYLPSIKQQRDIQYIPDRANLFNYARGEDFFKDGNYWSCVERSSTNAYAYIFDPAEPAKLTVYATKADTKKPQYVRAVLTF